jgi:hypothetical protein
MGRASLVLLFLAGVDTIETYGTLGLWNYLVSPSRVDDLFSGGNSSIREAVEELVFPHVTDLDQSFVNVSSYIDLVLGGACDNMTQSELAGLATETAAFKVSDHPDFGRLATRIAVHELHRRAPPTFSQAMEVLNNCAKFTDLP